MTYPVFFLVLIAAITHALWNSWIKVSGDRLVAFAILGIGWAAVGLVSVPLVGMPRTEAWTYLLASTVVHTVYALALIQSYKLGKLSVAYPIARGMGPLVVAFVSTIFIGDSLELNGIIGLLLIVAGIVWLGFPVSSPNYSSLLFSLLTGTLIGTYTLLDGLGGRIEGSPHVFAAWLFLLISFPVLLVAVAVHRRNFATLARPMWTKGIAAGVLSAAAYWIVIWAMTQAHMGLVAALRESSVVFAALIGALFLRERVRWMGVTLVVGGIVFMKLA